MNNQHLTLFNVDNKQILPLSMIPPPPLPPRFLPPHIIPPVLAPPPTICPPQVSDPSISSFPIHTFQGDNVSSTAMWTSCPPPQHHSVTDNGSQQKVNCWLKSKKTPEVVFRPNYNPKIYQVKEKLNTAFILIKELENGTRTLNVMLKSVTPFEWDEKCNEIETKKKELISVLNELKLSKEEIDIIKVKCLNRSKKRARLRRQALKRKLQKENNNVNRQNLHFRIDNWQKEMQEVVERTKREREIQQEADAVLWGVRQRRAEARHQFELLSTLQELREARVRKRSAAGQSTSFVEIETFTTVVERLKALWSRYLAECQSEEQALRVMLAESEVSQDSVATFKKLVLQEWQVALFGSSNSLETNSSLLDTRRSWDRFIVDGDKVLASTIPPGWVLPVPPSSNQWQSLLRY